MYKNSAPFSIQCTLEFFTASGVSQEQNIHPAPS